MKRAVVALAALLCAIACQARISVLDDSGHSVSLDAPARRVVSLAPHLTEMAFAVGGGAAVKAVIRYSDHPAAARQLPVVGDAFALDFEAIARLKPDLVLVWASGLNERHRARLRALGLVIYESEIRQSKAIPDTLRRLGVLLGHGAEAEAAAASFERDWQSLRERHAGKPPLRVFWQLWQDPLMTVNREHLIGEPGCAAAAGAVRAGCCSPSCSRHAGRRGARALLLAVLGVLGRPDGGAARRRRRSSSAGRSWRAVALARRGC